MTPRSRNPRRRFGCQSIQIVPNYAKGMVGYRGTFNGWPGAAIGQNFNVVGLLTPSRSRLIALHHGGRCVGFRAT